MGRTQNAVGVYVTMNPCDPRPAGSRREPSHHGNQRNNVDVRWRHRRPSPAHDRFRPGATGAVSSATDEEKSLAFQLAEEVSADLSFLGWPEPILADSGNGYHLNYAVDLPVDDGGLVERFLKSLAAKYNTPAVKVDTALSIPAGSSSSTGPWHARGTRSTTDHIDGRCYLGAGVSDDG